jgi:hypothetical protein
VIGTRAAECYSLAGFRFELDCDEPLIGQQFRRTFLPFATATEESEEHRYVVNSDGAVYRLSFDGEEVCIDDSWERLYAYLEWHAVQAALSTVNGFVALHAAAVCRDGRALLLSGPSGAGKSTLTLELLRHGCEFMSDEAVLLSAEGVRGFPRAIVLKADPNGDSTIGPSVAERLYCPPWEASLEVVTSTVTPCAVVLLLETGLPTRLERLAGASAFPYLLEQAFASRENPAVPEAVALLLQRTPAYSLTVDRVEDGAKLLSGLLDSRNVQ